MKSTLSLRNRFLRNASATGKDGFTEGYNAGWKLGLPKGQSRLHDHGITDEEHRRRAKTRGASLCLAAALLLFGLASCTGENTSSEGKTSGPSFERTALTLAPFDESMATLSNGALIDASHLSEGYVAVSASSDSRLKLQVSSGDMSYYYDLPSNGAAISCPLNMGDGTYEFTVWENTSGNRYAALSDTLSYDVQLTDEFQPFIRPSAYCSYDEGSASTQRANELCANAQNEADVLRAIYTWMTENVTYDEDKAAQLANATGYVPNPDETLESKSGICFDYASLAAAMLRSQGIPCKIITGNVSPDNIYHAWNMVYIDGTWVIASISVDQNTWTRIDLTFAAGSGSPSVGDGVSYTERYTY